MDRLAKAYLNHSDNLGNLSNIIKEEEWYVKAQGKKISFKAKKTIDTMLRQLNVTKYWTEPRKRSGRWEEAKFTHGQLEQIDTVNIQKAWEKQEGHLKHFICKMSVNQLATGRYMKRMRFWPTDQCPCCLCTNETTLHVFQCTHSDVQELANTLQEELLTKLQQHPTFFYIFSLIKVITSTY